MMDDLLSAAMSESGLSFEDSNNIDVAIPENTAEAGILNEVNIKPGTSSKEPCRFELPLSGKASVPVIFRRTSSAGSGPCVNAENNKKTIIIKTLPISNLVAPILNRNSKLPIKFIEKGMVVCTNSPSPSTVTKTNLLANMKGIPINVDLLQSGALINSMITITMGKDGKAIFTKLPESFTRNQVPGLKMTSCVSNVTHGGDNKGVIKPLKQTGNFKRLTLAPVHTTLQVKQNLKPQSLHSGSNTVIVSKDGSMTPEIDRYGKIRDVLSLNGAKSPGFLSGPSLGNPLKLNPNKRGSVASPLYANTVTSRYSKPRVVNQFEEYDDDDEEAEEELGHTDTYANYMPFKVKVGLPHPDAVVETSSLASVEPPDVLYNLSIPEKIMDMGHLSALQLEAITYACQKHDTFLKNGDRAGFLIGDGAGVGKGRTVAGVIFENYLQGRKRALWFSVSNDLKFDAQRDLKDIGASNIPLHSLNKFKYVKINSKENNYIRKGVIFATYSALIGESQNKSKYRTRLKQILHWCGRDFDGVIVLDECHKAKNLVPSSSAKPTKTGVTVLELQKQLPKARIIYCSATGASEPRNMAYMSRLAIWGKGTPFPDFLSFIQAVEKRGMGAMEIVAMDMKLRGMYIARQLSFHGVGFSIQEIPLNDDFKQMYNRSAQLWHIARDRFQKAAAIMSGDPSFSNSMWGQFWSAHQRFFKYLCIAAKVREAVRYSKEAIKMGKCVVIGLQSTGEARTLDALEEAGGELCDFVSTAKGVFGSLLEKHFPAPNRAKTASLFGLNFHEDSKNKSDKTRKSSKRKQILPKDGNNHKKAKRRRNDASDDDMSDSSNDSDFSDVNSKKETLSSGLSSSEDEEEDDEDCNPFGDSDSDDDPWLKKGMKKKGKKKTPKKEKQKDPEEAQMQTMADSALRALGITPKKSVPKKNPKLSTCDKINGLTLPHLPSATSSLCLPGMDGYDRVSLMKQELTDMLEELGPILPPNTLDELIEELGGTDNVAEMTGRKGRVVSNEVGNVQYESRCEMDVPLEILNLTEKKRFMDGEKFIAIISEAASSGISLQADRRVANQKRRVHITLEIPWSADRAVQQFGRTHRSNQVSAPEYVFLISELAGERRFASIVAKRLECLGALTHGDRRASESRDLSQFNIDNKYGRLALERVMKSIIGLESALVNIPRETFFVECRKALVGVGIIQDMGGYFTLDKDYNSLPKFLNRLLGIEVDLQNELFSYFNDTLTEIITSVKKEGLWDMGILDIISEGQVVKKLETHTYIGSFSSGTATSHLHKVSAERGMRWRLAVDLWSSLLSHDEGFYVSLKSCNGKKLAILAKFAPKSVAKKGMLHIYRPNLGQQMKTETLSDLKKKYKKVVPDEAKEHWENHFTASATSCSHEHWRGICRNVAVGIPCDTGLRSRTFFILSGSVLSVWTRVEKILVATNGGRESKMQIIRVKTANNTKLVGLLIPQNCVEAIKRELSQGATYFSDIFDEDI